MILGLIIFALIVFYLIAGLICIYYVNIESPFAEPIIICSWPYFLIKSLKNKLKTKKNAQTVDQNITSFLAFEIEAVRQRAAQEAQFGIALGQQEARRQINETGIYQRYFSETLENENNRRLRTMPTDDNVGVITGPQINIEYTNNAADYITPFPVDTVGAMYHAMPLTDADDDYTKKFQSNRGKNYSKFAEWSKSVKKSNS